MHLKLSDDVGLSELAEKVVSEKAWRLDPESTPETLLHELLLHRTELEMQNEALREAQTQLTQSEARCRDLFDQAPIGYVVLDAAGRVQAANVRAAELFVMTPDELLGTRLQDYLVPGDV